MSAVVSMARRRREKLATETTQPGRKRRVESITSGLVRRWTTSPSIWRNCDSTCELLTNLKGDRPSPSDATVPHHTQNVSHTRSRYELSSENYRIRGVTLLE